MQKKTIQERPKANGPLRVEDQYNIIHTSSNEDLIALTDLVSIPEPTPSSQGIHLI